MRQRETEHQRRLEELPERGLINRNDFADFLGVKESTIRIWEKSLNGFPVPIRISRGCTRYDVAEVNQWYQRLRNERAAG